MNQLVWDAALETYAQNYANTCPIAKNPEQKYNENILVGNYGSYLPTLAQADLAWSFNNWKDMT
jgi:hypothetical protein